MTCSFCTSAAGNHSVRLEVSLVACGAGLPADPLSSIMADKERDMMSRCTWDGDIHTFQDYIRRVRLMYEKTRRRRRKLLGPELVTQLSGRAWVITQEIDHLRLTQSDGAHYLIKFLEEKLGRTPVPAAGSYAEELFVRMRRPSGMSMATWCSQVRESYRKLQRALKRARQEQGEGAPDVPAETSTSPSPSRSARRGSRQSVPEPQPEGGHDEVPAETDPVTAGFGSPTSQGSKGKGKYYRLRPDSSSSSEVGEDAAFQEWEALDRGLPEVLPTELVGWLMLRRCGLSAAQRLNVLASIGNSLRAEDVERGLRGAEEDLRLHERENDHRKGGPKGGRGRSNFWVEQDGEWGLVVNPGGDFEEAVEEGAVTWVGSDIAGVYGLQASSKPSAGEEDDEGFWNQEPDGSYSWWSLAMDGEFYHTDAGGAFWAWSEYDPESVFWQASPEQEKELAEAFAAYEGKLRNFTESRQLLQTQRTSRGFYPKGKGKGKFGKSKGKNKNKNPPVFVATTPPLPMTSTTSSSQVMAAVGTPGYTGCFICGGKDHDFRKCPNRGSSSGKGKGGKAFGVFMVEEANVGDKEMVCEMAFSLNPSMHALTMITQPEMEGFAVIDSGATETVGSLEALECVVKKRLATVGPGPHYHVVQGPPKNFRFGNGETRYSESYVLLMQSLGAQTIALGIYTLQASNVPILLGIKSLRKLGAILDCEQGLLVLKAVNHELLIPLRRSTSGHLLVDLGGNWLAGGSKMPTSSVPSADEDVIAKDMQDSSSSAFMVNDENSQDSRCQNPMHATSLSDLPQSSVSAVASQEREGEKNHEKVCKISGDGDAFGVSTTSDGQLHFTPLSLEAQDSWTTSMNVLKALTRSTSASITSSLRSNGFSGGSTQDGQQESREVREEGRSLERKVRCVEASWTGSERSKDNWTSLRRSTSTSGSLQRQCDWEQRPCGLDRLRALQTSPILHTCLRSSWNDPISGSFAQGHQGSSGDLGKSSSWKRGTSGQEHWLHGSGEQLDEEVGACSGLEEKCLRPKQEGGHTFDTRSHAQNGGDRGCGADGTNRTQEATSQVRPDSRGLGSCRDGVLGPTYSTRNPVKKLDVRDVELKDYDMKVLHCRRGDNFVDQYVQAPAVNFAIDYLKVPEYDILGKNDQVLMSNDALEENAVLEDEKLFEEQFGCFVPLASPLKQHLENIVADLRKETEETFYQCVGDKMPPMDVMEVCCEEDSLLVTMVEQRGGRGMRLGLFNGYDLLTDSGLQKAVQAVREHRPRVLWISMPCGATSPIQHLNELTPEARKKSMKRRQRSKKLVRNGVKLMNEQLCLGGEVLQEWPFPNDAWRQREVQELWQALEQAGRSETVRVDGCAYGLRCEEGFLKKPWMLRSSRPGLFTALGRRCNGLHSHVPTLGVKARRSALYTPSMCRVAARCIMDFDVAQSFAVVEARPDYEGLKALTTQELERLYATVVKLHRLCGHPSNRALVKTLAARGASGTTLAVAEKLHCLECAEGKISTPGPSVSLHKEETLWSTLQMDSFTFRYNGKVHHFLLCLDEASGFSVVQEMLVHQEEEHENINTPSVVATLEQSWIQYFGFPKRIRLDQEGAFRGTGLHDWCGERGIELDFVPAEHHESTGDVERAIGELRKKMVAHLRNEDVTPRQAAWSMCSAHNHVARVGGFSPAQWAFGRGVPDPDNLAALSSQADPAHEMHGNLNLRLRAEQRYRELQAKAKVSRALNSKVQRSTQFLPGDLVFYRRYKVPADYPANQLVDLPSMKVARWYGPGRVLASETRLEDDGMTRAATSIVWIITQGRLKKIHSSQLRHSSERERAIAEATEAPTTPWTFSSLGRTLTQGQYEDLTQSFHRQPAGPRTPRTRSLTPGRPRRRSRSRGGQRQGSRWDQEPLSVVNEGQPSQQQPSLPPQGPAVEQETVDVDIDRLFNDTSYLPLKRLPSSEVPEDFARTRRRQEQQEKEESTSSSMALTLEETPNDFIGWCRDSANDFVLGVTIPIPQSEQEWKKILKNPSKFTSKAVLKGAEVSWAKLNPEQRAAMKEAKQMEVDQWVVRKVIERFRGSIPPNRLMKSRWVLTFKAVENDENVVKAKARIVLLGFTDPDLGELETCAPTLTRRSRQLLLGLSMHRRWHQVKADAKSAFLQGGPTQNKRDIFIVPVPELAQELGIPPGESAKLLRAAYGLVSAPKEWFNEVHETLVAKCGLRRLATDPCIWICEEKVNGKITTTGYIAAHVDDFLISGCGDSKKWNQAVECFRQAYVWSPWENTPYTHCGVGLDQTPDYGFVLQHHSYCEEIKQVDIDDASPEVTKDEISQARAVLGAIQWRALQTAPQHMAKLSWLQSSMAHISKDILRQVNRLCREVFAQRYLSVQVKQLGAINDEDICFACWTDAAVGNRPDMGSTGGYVVGMVRRDFLSGERGPVNPVAWRSGKLPRVARSSLSAEIQALAEGEQELMFCRLEWAELLGYPMDLMRPEQTTSLVSAAIIVDAKSVFDAFHKGDAATSAFGMKEKYAALELMAVSENLRKQNTAMLWVSSEAQLADGLTKAGAQDFFKQFLQGNQQWIVRYDPEFIAAKKKKKARLHPEPVEDQELIPDVSFRDLIKRHKQETPAKTFWAV